MARKRKKAGRGCFARVSKKCGRFARATGRSFRVCMSGALKRECFKGKGKRGSKRCRWGRVKTGPRKGQCRTQKPGRRWHKSGRSGARSLYGL